MTEDTKKPASELTEPRRIAGLSDPGLAAPRGFEDAPRTDPGARASGPARLADLGGGLAGLSDPSGEAVLDDAAAGQVFVPLDDWLAAAQRKVMLERMAAGIDHDIYADVLGARPSIDPHTVERSAALARLHEVEARVKTYAGSQAFQHLANQILKRWLVVAAALSSDGNKHDLDKKVLALREQRLLEDVWTKIESKFDDDAHFSWAEQVDGRKNAAKRLTDDQWRALLEKIERHVVTVNGEKRPVAVQTHSQATGDAIRQELTLASLVSPKKAQAWVAELAETLGPAAAQRFIEDAIKSGGGRIGEVTSSNRLMNLRGGRAVHSPEELVALCAADRDVRAEVADKLKTGRLANSLQDWIDGIHDEGDKKGPQALLAMVTSTETTALLGRDAQLGLDAFLWAAGETRLPILEKSVESVEGLVAAIDGRIARIAPVLEGHALELWLAHALKNDVLAKIARDCSGRGEIGAWTFLWAAGEKRLRLGKRVLRDVDELCEGVASGEARKGAAGAIDDGTLLEWLRHAQRKPELVRVLDDYRKRPAATAIWAVAYAAGLKRLDLGDGASVSTKEELVAWLPGHLHALADRLGDELLEERLGLWLARQKPDVSWSAMLASTPRTALHLVAWAGTGPHKLWLDDETSADGPAALADILAETPKWIDEIAADRDRTKLLAHFAKDTSPNLDIELSTKREATLRAAAVVRALDPSREIAVADERIPVGAALPFARHGLARDVLAAIDKARLWERMDAARLALQELFMTLRANNAYDVAARLATALGITGKDSPFPAAALAPEHVLRAVFAFHEGKRPFRGGARTLAEVGWALVAEPALWDESTAAIERRLWLEQEGLPTEYEALPDFLYAAFPEQGTRTLDVTEAKEELDGVYVTWQLRRSLALQNPEAPHLRYQHVDSAATAGHTGSCLGRQHGLGIKTRSVALAKTLVQLAKEQSGALTIVNEAEIPASIAARLAEARGRRRQERRTQTLAAGAGLAPEALEVSVHALPGLVALFSVFSIGLVDHVTMTGTGFMVTVLVAAMASTVALLVLRRDEWNLALWGALVTWVLPLVGLFASMHATTIGAAAIVIGIAAVAVESKTKDGKIAGLGCGGAIALLALSFGGSFLVHAVDDVLRWGFVLGAALWSGGALVARHRGAGLSAGGGGVVAGLLLATLGAVLVSLVVAAAFFPERSSWWKWETTAVSASTPEAGQAQPPGDATAPPTRPPETRYIATTRTTLRELPDDSSTAAGFAVINTPCTVRDGTGAFAALRCGSVEGWAPVAQLSLAPLDASTVLAQARAATSPRERLKLAARSSAIAQSPEADEIARVAFFAAELADLQAVRKKKKRPEVKVERVACLRSTRALECLASALALEQQPAPTWVRVATRAQDFSAALFYGSTGVLEARSGRLAREGDELVVRVEITTSSTPVMMPDILGRGPAILRLGGDDPRSGDDSQNDDDQRAEDAVPSRAERARPSDEPILPHASDTPAPPRKRPSDEPLSAGSATP